MKRLLLYFENIIISSIIACLFLAGCSERDAARTPDQGRSSVSTSEIDDDDYVKELVESYWEALREIERDSGKESSHSFYSQFTFKEHDEEKVMKCAQWVLAHSWVDQSTTSSALLKAIEDHRDNLNLLSRGALIDNPFLPPKRGFETPIPNWRKIYLIALLHLAEGKRKTAEKIIYPKYDSLDSEARLGVETLIFGDHFMIDNATLFHYLIGNGIRCAAADYLIWIMENDYALTLDRVGLIRQIVEREEKRNRVFTGWRDEMLTFRDSLAEIYKDAIPASPPIDFVNHLKISLSREMNVSSDTLTLDKIREIYSIDALTRYFDEYIALGESFAQLTPLEREDEEESYRARAMELTPRRSPYLKDAAIPDLVIPLRMEEIVTAKLRLIASSLATQEGIKMKRAANHQQAVRVMNIGSFWAIDPFTSRPFTSLYMKPGRLTLVSQPPEWFYEMDLVYALNGKIAIDFSIPRDKVRE